MSLNRWKIMAGMLTVSLGGLAAVAAQCQKSDATKNPKKPAEEVALADTKPSPAPPAASPLIPVAAPPAAPTSGPSAPLLAPPLVLAPSSGPLVPPSIDSPADTLPKSPPVVLPGSYQAPNGNGVLPSAPALPAPSADKGMKKPVEPVESRLTAPDSTPFPPTTTSEIAPSAPSFSAPLEKPSEPKKKPESPARGVSSSPPSIPSTDVIAPPTTVIQPVPMPAPATGPVEPPVITAIPPANVPKPDELTVKPVVVPAAPAATVPTTHPAVVPASSVSTASAKLRIVLRVGEGEPNFEVRSGDDLLLKVICDKVDILSPEKGSGLSSVKARGKVHFAGFGAEGTCDELAFLAGTGEVSMTGNVKIQVKDKLGRIESELATESVKYRIDPSSIGGMLKP